MHSLHTQINGLTTYYTLAGRATNPTLVFLHAMGARSSRFSWFNGIEPVIKALSQHFYVIAPEHPGLIHSETPSASWDLEDRAIHLHQLLEELKMTNPILVGNSFGGGVATDYAIRYPKQLNRLILIDSVVSSAYPESSKVTQSTEQYIQLLRRTTIPLWIKRLMVWWRFATPLNLATPEDIRRKVLMLNNALAQKFTVDYASLKPPVTLLWGKQDTTHPIAYARSIVLKAPTIKLVEYKGTVSTIYHKPSRLIPIIVEISKQ